MTKNHGLLSLFQGGGRSWQDFGEGKNDHKNFPQARAYYSCNKCVVLARNKFAH